MQSLDVENPSPAISEPQPQPTSAINQEDPSSDAIPITTSSTETSAVGSFESSHSVLRQRIPESAEMTSFHTSITSSTTTLAPSTVSTISPQHNFSVTTTPRQHSSSVTTTPRHTTLAPTAASTEALHSSATPTGLNAGIRSASPSLPTSSLGRTLNSGLLLSCFCLLVLLVFRRLYLLAEDTSGALVTPDDETSY